METKIIYQAPACQEYILNLESTLCEMSGNFEDFSKGDDPEWDVDDDLII